MEEVSLADFVDFLAVLPDAYSDPHWISQTQLLADTDGRLLVDFVGRVENAEADLAHVLSIIGKPDGDATFPHRVQTHSHRIELGAREASLLSQRYARDRELLGY